MTYTVKIVLIWGASRCDTMEMVALTVDVTVVFSSVAVGWTAINVTSVAFRVVHYETMKRFSAPKSFRRLSMSRNRHLHWGDVG
jgi:hypothetical protein